jgi:hypothetical protein
MGASGILPTACLRAPLPLGRRSDGYRPLQPAGATGHTSHAQSRSPFPRPARLKLTSRFRPTASAGVRLHYPQPSTAIGAIGGHRLAPPRPWQTAGVAPPPPPASPAPLPLASSSPKCNNKAVARHTILAIKKSFQVDRRLPLALLRQNGTVPSVRSDACTMPPTPPRLRSRLPAAGSTPSLPRSIRRGAARDPTPPAGWPRLHRADRNAPRVRRRVPVCHPNPFKVSQMPGSHPASTLRETGIRKSPFRISVITLFRIAANQYLTISAKGDTRRIAIPHNRISGRYT